MTTPSFQLGVDSGIVLGYGTANQAVIKGLNSITLPALMRTKVKVSEFRTDFAVGFAGEGEHGDMSYGGNMVLGDTLGQDQLKQNLKLNTKMTDCRVYLDLINFMAPDLANDANAGFQVLNHTPGAGTKNNTYPFTGAWCTNGLYCYFTAHIVDGATPTMAFTANTVTDTGNGFVTAGFKDGQTMIVEGSPSNDKQVLIDTVEAGVITLAAGHTFNVENAVEGTTLHGGIL